MRSYGKIHGKERQKTTPGRGFAGNPKTRLLSPSRSENFKKAIRIFTSKLFFKIKKPLARETPKIILKTKKTLQTKFIILIYSR